MKRSPVPNKLTQTGFDHIIVPIACFVVFALIGSYFLYASLAATTPWKGILEVSSQNSGYCLTTTGSTTGSGIELDPCSKTYDADQIWTLNDIRTATIDKGSVVAVTESDVQEFDLQSAAGTNECIANIGTGQSTSYPAKLDTCSTSSTAMTWFWNTKFSVLGFSTHQLRNLDAPGLCLDDQRGSDNPGTYVGLYTCKTTTQSNQEWFEAGAPSMSGSGNGSSVSDPSGQDPPASLTGYTLKYTQEFNGSSVPSAFGAYNGTPGGYTASDAQWVSSMCSVSGGELHMMASGIDSCGGSLNVNPMTYGAWFVRMKGDVEPPGRFSDIALLWPVSNTWTAEIDFYEDQDVVNNRSQYGATLYAGPNGTDPYQVPSITNDGSEWHTYGVERTPKSVTYLDDGKVVASFPTDPNVPMYLDLQSQDLNGSPVAVGTETMTVDWIAEFSYN